MPRSLLLCVLALAACSTNQSTPGAGVDASTPAVDGASSTDSAPSEEAAADSPSVVDAGTYAEAGPIEGLVDAAMNSPSVLDAGTDADAGPIEGSADAATDSPSVLDAGTDADARSNDGSAEASSSDAGCGSGPNLIVNGSFEEPVVSVGGFQTFAEGSSFSGWTVVGASGNVAPLSTAYTENGLHWTAECGAQTLDLTGLSNTATGVSQSVATTAGTSYTLTFWVGNVVDTANGWGSSSTVDVLVNGNQVLAATNSNGAGATSLDWQLFTVHFMATSASTTIEFLNGDPAGDNSNILDNVVLN